ncbi:MAG: NAD(P)-binding protein [Deltaproteobacteria bacterium]|nr:NAD(P)-binding protein [Deltaproteobacteria bacterium]
MHAPDTPRVPALILGAGLTGLSSAVHLGDPARYRLLERHPTQVGGLAKTLRRPGGFLCDGTGHWLHLRTEEMRRLVDDALQGNLLERERRARVYSKGVFTLYPFQANTFGLPKEVIAECLNGLLKARYEEHLPEPKNYREWIRKEFGDGICEHFMVPYNEKIYGVPLESLAADFAAKYIPRPSIEAVVNGALGLSKEALGYNARFVYPKQGGIGALSEGLHAKLVRKAEHGREPKQIDLVARSVTMRDGEVIRYERLINTIPLNDFVQLCVAGHASSVPVPVVEAAKKLRANSVFYFDVAIKGAPKEHQDYHWIYFPEKDFPFYRVGSYSAVEPSLAPAGHRCYYVEFGHYGEVDPKRFEQPLLDGLRRAGLITDEDQLVFVIPNVLSPAYVLFDDQYQVARRTILDWLASQSVVSVGRYGRWQYNAMEDALLEGKEAAELVSSR